MIGNSKGYYTSSGKLNPQAMTFVPKSFQTPLPNVDQKVSQAYEQKKSLEKEQEDLKRADTRDYEELMDLIREEVFSGTELEPQALAPPKISSQPETIEEKLEKVVDYSSLMEILTRHAHSLQKKDIKKAVEVLFNFYWINRMDPPKEVVEKIETLILSRIDSFAFYELRRFLDVLQRVEVAGSQICSEISNRLYPEQYYLAHLYPRRHSDWEIHPIDDAHMKNVVRNNGLHCSKCGETFAENPGMRLVKGCISSVKSVNSLRWVKRLEELKALGLTEKPINFPEVQKWTKELEHCIRTNNVKTVRNVIEKLLKNGGKISSEMQELAHRSACSYQILTSLIAATKTVTIQDFHIAFAREYPLETISFMLLYLSGQGKESLENVMVTALKVGSSQEVLQLLLDAGAKITPLCINAALQHSSPDILDFVIAHNSGGKICPANDLPYIEMSKLPRGKWDYIFSKLGAPFTEDTMHTILNHFLSLNILREITSEEWDAAQFFLEKGGYIPNMTIEPILMSGLSQERKIGFLRRWVEEGGVVSADLIDFAITPKTSRKECLNSRELVEYLFSQWTVEQEKIPSLLKAFARWTDFVDFIKMLMDKSENLQFVDEFLRHKKAEEIVEHFLSKNGQIPSSSIPLILCSDLSFSLKQRLLSLWKDQGGEVSSEILDSALSSANYKNLHEIVDYLLPFWKVEPEKLSSLIKTACFGGASLSVIKSLIDMYENPPFIVELLYHDDLALELYPYFHSKGMEVTSDIVSLALSFPGCLHRPVGKQFPVREDPFLLRGKEAKLWLISHWAQGQKIVSSEMLTLAKNYKNDPEVLALLESLKKEEEPQQVVDDMVQHFSEMGIAKPIAQKFDPSRRISLEHPANSSPDSRKGSDLKSCIKSASGDQTAMRLKPERRVSFSS